MVMVVWHALQARLQGTPTCAFLHHASSVCCSMCEFTVKLIAHNMQTCKTNQEFLPAANAAKDYMYLTLGEHMFWLYD